MKIIYIVTQGVYSDYCIRGVFDSRELAEKYIAAFSESQYCNTMRIEEWEVNPFKYELQNGYKPYFVRMDREGNTIEIMVADTAYGFENGTLYGVDANGNMYNCCFAKSNEHAIKITNERRIQIIAEGNWPSD